MVSRATENAGTGPEVEGVADGSADDRAMTSPDEAQSAPATLSATKTTMRMVPRATSPMVRMVSSHGHAFRPVPGHVPQRSPARDLQFTFRAPLFTRGQAASGSAEIVKIPNRGHALTIDHGWRDVAQTALDFVQRSLGAKDLPTAVGQRQAELGTRPRVRH